MADFIFNTLDIGDYVVRLLMSLFGVFIAWALMFVFSLIGDSITQLKSITMCMNLGILCSGFFIIGGCWSLAPGDMLRSFSWLAVPISLPLSILLQNYYCGVYTRLTNSPVLGEKYTVMHMGVMMVGTVTSFESQFLNMSEQSTKSGEIIVAQVPWKDVYGYGLKKIKDNREYINPHSYSYQENTNHFRAN